MGFQDAILTGPQVHSGFQGGIVAGTMVLFSFKDGIVTGTTGSLGLSGWNSDKDHRLTWAFSME